MPLICIADDRPACEPGLRLLLISLQRHCREARVELFYPPASGAFCSWLEQFPSINLNTSWIPGAWGWNVKPQAILTLFERGYDDVLWIDSDILITRNFQTFFRGLVPEVMVLTEEALAGTADPDGLRARLWGFKVGRCLPFAANTAIVRANTFHAGLLKRWMSLFQDERYRRAQQQEWMERPVHLIGDQDVLTALLASEQYADVPVHFLRRGKHIIQFGGPPGYTVTERLYHVAFGMPPFVHSPGLKPWLRDDIVKVRGWRQIFESLYRELSPYTMLAREYRRQLQDGEWMERSSLCGKVLRVLGLYYPPLTGLPLAIAADIFRAAKRAAFYFFRQPSKPRAHVGI